MPSTPRETLTRGQPTSAPTRARSTLGVVGLMVVFGLVGLQWGCETTAVRALRGARHYAAGNDALERKDRARAIEELEQAAVLVPHASEIQNHLGLAYWSDGHLEAARLSFEQALELNCENQAAATNLEKLMSANRSSLGTTDVADLADLPADTPGTLDTDDRNDAQSAQADGAGGSTDGG